MKREPRTSQPRTLPGALIVYAMIVAGAAAVLVIGYLAVAFVLIARDFIAD